MLIFLDIHLEGFAQTRIRKADKNLLCVTYDNFQFMEYLFKCKFEGNYFLI